MRGYFLLIICFSAALVSARPQQTEDEYYDEGEYFYQEYDENGEEYGYYNYNDQIDEYGVSREEEPDVSPTTTASTTTTTRRTTTTTTTRRPYIPIRTTTRY